VLNKPSRADRDLIDRAVDEAVHHSADILRGDVAGAMNRLNGFKA
jgi:PTH1 family peptidyl-tRNA hydrolase